MSIAVVHHFDQEEDRIKAVKEMIRVLKPNGKLLFTVWAYESDEYSCKKKFNIGYFGSLYKSRGLDLIIKLASIDPKNDYYVYGNKKKTKLSFSKKIEKNLHLNDYVPYKKISKILLNMDLLLMPYTSSITVAGDVGDITKYTSPLKLFDYLCVGRPIICSNFNVLKEIIANNKNAIFVKNYKNPFAWRKEITKLINNPEKMKIISKNNYRLSKKYSHSARASKILDLVK